MARRWIATMLLFGIPAWAQTLKITARIYKQAYLPQAVLLSAEKEADYALGTAGVQVHWVNCNGSGTCDGPVGQNEFDILIRNAPPASTTRSQPVETMGMALLPHDGAGSYAMVYYNEICRTAGNSLEVPLEGILGYVIAHEIGHLLLGASHKDGTVMQSQWTKVELAMVKNHQLRFNRFQNVGQNGIHGKN